MSEDKVGRILFIVVVAMAGVSLYTLYLAFVAR